MRSGITIGLILTLAGCAAQQASYAPAPPPRRIAPPPRTIAPPKQAAARAPLRVPATVPSAGPLRTAMIGSYMDNQERDFREHLRGLPVGVARPGDEIVLSSKDEKWFEDGSTELSPAGADALTAIAIILRHYDHTIVSIRDFTDAGWDKKAPDPRDRAQIVAHRLIAAGVQANRVFAQGYGATRRSLTDGKRISEPRNRRIELRISPRASG
jgi:outer membrane protein OmpA-like peptidoglycan-associated protein